MLSPLLWTRHSEAKIFRAREEVKTVIRRGRKPEGLLIHGLERLFRLDSTQRGDGFSERARK